MSLPDPRLSRRTVLGGGLAAAAAAAALPAWAQRSFQVPEVDRLTVHFLVDHSTFAFAEPVRRPDLLVTRTARPAKHSYQRALMAEFGLSLLAESRRGREVRTVLVDFGYTPQVLLNNLELLGFDPARIDAAVLSHGHWDHFGGLSGLLGTKARLKRGLPLYVGGEEAFCEREALLGGKPSPFGTLDRAALLAAGLRVHVVPQPRVVAEHAFTTGHIPLSTFERAAIPTQMKPGHGCERSALSPAKREADVVRDDGEHELATAYHVKGRGLVVLGSCSHRGVLNTVQRAQAVSGVKRLHAVLGGFHLVAPRTHEEARATVPLLEALNPDYVVPGHCSGEVFIAEALARMPGKVIRPYVGSSFTFGAQD